jgi:hypothetical protein
MTSAIVSYFSGVDVRLAGLAMIALDQRRVSAVASFSSMAGRVTSESAMGQVLPSTEHRV